MSLPYKTVTIVGLGYIGLPTAAVLASRGIHVIGVDTNSVVVEVVNRGEIHIVEPDLEAVVNGAVKGGFLRASGTPELADAFIIAVPTPFKKAHEPDLSYVEAAIRSIAPFLREGNLVILESTSPVGTTQKIDRWLSDMRSDLTFPSIAGENAQINIAYCPERVLPGKILTELLDNDRVVGGLTPKCAQRAIELYRTFVKGECLTTNARTAELCKLTENAFRDVNIAFANELSLVCDKLDISVWELVRLANHHPRVNILQPGPGVGGHCIAVDPWFIVSSAPEQAKIIRLAREVNDAKPEWVIQKVVDKALTTLARRVAFFGLSFKANIDDLRESPAVSIVHRFSQLFGGSILVVEPYISDLPNKLARLGNVSLVSQETAIKQADIIVGLVDHSVFKKIPIDELEEKCVIDVRGIWVA